MSDRYYEDYRLAEFYDELYYELYDLKFWKKYLKKQSKILEFACGTGRLTIPLVEEGLHVHAVDYSPEMLSILNKKKKELPEKTQKRLSTEVADMRNFKTNNLYDAV